MFGAGPPQSALPASLFIRFTRAMRSGTRAGPGFLGSGPARPGRCLTFATVADTSLTPA
ncbi:hypothetical protein MPS_4533 [Mycobacterium pseudoshottsii JCM 15466]|nr:hypothetical protein [Mycobacterium pseudoshottsii]GAQ39109.1 hypothetical protein MPS_4533 [Mycobacterium pseudoshottsii JCM 15466]